MKKQTHTRSAQKQEKSFASARAGSPLPIVQNPRHRAAIAVGYLERKTITVNFEAGRLFGKFTEMFHGYQLARRYMELTGKGRRHMPILARSRSGRFDPTLERRGPKTPSGRVGMECRIAPKP